MNVQQKAEDWLKVIKNVRGRDLAWHLEGILQADGEAVLAEVIRRLDIVTTVDLVKRSA